MSEVPSLDEAAMARLAEIERQEPVAEMTLVDMGIGDARQLRVNWLMDGYLDVGAKSYASAGASPVEPKEVIKEIVVHADYREMWRQQLKMNQQLNAALSAQPPAPSDTAITYMTGYSDGREWAAAPIPQQPSVPEGWKLVPIEPTAEMCLAARQVPEPNKPYPPHFHLIWDAMLAAALTAAKQAQPERAPLSDAELEQEFCKITGLETGINPAAADAKRALVWFKKGYAHGIKQGGQHEKDQ